jgi:hypothetical protein
VSERAASPRPAWRDLFDDPALGRLVRLAGLRGSEQLVWLGPGEKIAKQLEKISERSVTVHADLEEIPKRSLGLLVAPEIVDQIGVDKALRQLRGVLETDGVVAIVLGAAIGEGPGDAERAEWEGRQHGPLESVMAVMGRFAAAGYEPLTAEVPALEPGSGSANAGLGLFVGRRVEPGTPPRWPRRAGME